MVSALAAGGNSQTHNMDVGDGTGASSGARKTCSGVASLKEFVLSSRFSRFFFSVCRCSGRTFHAEAFGFFFNVLVLTNEKSFCGRLTHSWVDRSRSFHRVRSQSFLSVRLHPNTSLRVSACLTASAQAAWS